MRERRAAWAMVLGIGVLGWGVGGCGARDEPTVMFSGRVADIFTAQAIEEVTVCRLDSPNRGCSVTDAQGRFSLALPTNEDNWFTVTHEDYYPFLLAISSEEEDIELPGPVTIGSRETMEFVLSQTGVSVEPGQGHLLLWVADDTGLQGQAGATLSISPDPGGLVVYVDEQGAYSQDATSTSTAGSAGWGNIPPGDYVLTVSHPDLECVQYSAFPAGAPNTFELKTIPDHATALFVMCR